MEETTFRFSAEGEISIKTRSECRLRGGQRRAFWMEGTTWAKADL